MADHSTCLSPSCGAWADGSVAVCPRCGGPMKFTKGPTARGWALLVMGLFLASFMGAIAWYLLPTLLNPGEETGGFTFEGTAEQARLIAGLFAMLILVGLAFAVNGGIVIATGRQSRLLTVAGFVMIALLMLLAFVIVLALTP